MKKRLLALFMAATMSMALMACGGSKEEAATETATEEAVEETVEEEATEETTGDLTEEQAAFVDEFNSLVDEYNVVVDAVNANETLLSDQEVVDMMNEVTASIDELSGIISDETAGLTTEAMAACREEVFTELRNFIDAVNELLGVTETATDMSEKEELLKSIFTGAIVGSDEVENTYWFLFDDELTYGAFVILSADYTQSVNVVGEITSRDEDGALVITDESTNSYIAFTVVEEGEDYLVVQIEDGNQVTMINYDLDEAIATVVGIDETTEIIE